MLHVRFKSVKRLITTPFLKGYCIFEKPLKNVFKKNFEGLFFKDKIVVLQFQCFDV